MLTASRRDEVRCMQWSEIDAENGLWTVPAARTKTQKDHEIPLTPNMIELLAGLPRLGPSVFTVSGERTWGAHGKFKADLDKKSGVSNWPFQDIRRTVRSRLAEASVPFEIAERVLVTASLKSSGCTTAIATGRRKLARCRPGVIA
jgi:integrase